MAQMSDIQIPQFVYFNKVLTYNIDGNASPLFHYFGQNPFVNEFSAYIIERIKASFNSQEFLQILRNGRLEFLAKSRFSPLYRLLPLDLPLVKFMSEWNKIYMQSNDQYKINDSLIYQTMTPQEFRRQIMIYDWTIYKFLKDFCVHKNISVADFAHIYRNADVLYTGKLFKLMKIVQIKKPTMLFLQHISEHYAKNILAKQTKYTVYWANNMAILIGATCAKLKDVPKNVIEFPVKDLAINTQINEPFQIIVENSYVMFISAYIDNLDEFIRLIEFLKVEPRKIVVGFTSGIDLTEEKYDLHGLNLSWTTQTTKVDNCALHPLYGNLGETSGHYDYVLTSLEFHSNFIYYDQLSSHFNTEHFPLEVVLSNTANDENNQRLAV